MPRAPRIIESLPHRGEKVRISNYYGDEPSREMRDFCGSEVMKAVEQMQRKLTSPGNTRRGTMVFFQCADGKCYHIYCGHNRSRTMPGKFLYNVYLHPGDADK